MEQHSAASLGKRPFIIRNASGRVYSPGFQADSRRFRWGGLRRTPQFGHCLRLADLFQIWQIILQPVLLPPGSAPKEKI
jgi:hypothetical protein